jgi:hypothetical protein
MPEEYENLAESVQDTIAEHHQEAHRAEGNRPAWLDALAVSTALFAVLAAFASLKAGDSANEALYRANQAVLQQTQAVDTWSQFQADSIKKYQAQSLITLLPHVGGSATELQAAKGQVAARQKTQDALLLEARKRDAETARLSKESEGLLARHTRYALSVTLFQVAIGLAAIATLLRRRPLWWLSLGVGAAAATALLVGLL